MTTGRHHTRGEGRDHRGQVLRRGAAAAADDADSVLDGEAPQPGGEFGRRQRVDGPAADVLREAGIGQAGDGQRRVLAQVAHVLRHAVRADGAVEADHVQRVADERGERRADLGAEEHGAGALDGHLHHEGEVAPGLSPVLQHAHHGGLGLQDVLARLDEERVGAALEEAGRLLVVVGAQRVEIDVAEGGQFGAGAHGADDVAGALGRGELLGHLTGQGGRAVVQVVGAVGDAILRQHHAVGAEGIGLDGIAAGGQVGGMDAPDDVRPRLHEDLAAPLQAGVVLQRRIVRVNGCAHRAVENENAFAKRLAESLCPVQSHAPIIAHPGRRDEPPGTRRRASPPPVRAGNGQGTAGVSPTITLVRRRRSARLEQDGSAPGGGPGSPPLHPAPHSPQCICEAGVPESC